MRGNTLLVPSRLDNGILYVLLKIISKKFEIILRPTVHEFMFRLE